MKTKTLGLILIGVAVYLLLKRSTAAPASSPAESASAGAPAPETMPTGLSGNPAPVTQPNTVVGGGPADQPAFVAAS